MRFVTLEVEVDVSAVIAKLDDEDLAELGLIDAASVDDEAEPTDWQAIADAIRRADFRKAEELITEAARIAGSDLPPFAVARVA
ncbi:hypothetical protein BJI69_14170 [Luteibacter rhizovicinus DSM 16549]|uniref:Uncharacterized protein n=1 Tax=Luteibacter rhizovicinus DSM 16549 TaxID=1440763 RepID=A0A0G9HFG9_9GAMM|nr:hypothetical protein [Luteibacter rhizovicinus]APG04923.1 hypothetical protein BJI69_14170 [Luteibacter rhizovicinus DSM 16549]KLD68473.1 hypothetical protein Y883_01995 [Luteibacter rhizovicinus DSM 16549]